MSRGIRLVISSEFYATMVWIFAEGFDFEV